MDTSIRTAAPCHSPSRSPPSGAAATGASSRPWCRRVAGGRLAAGAACEVQRQGGGGRGCAARGSVAPCSCGHAALLIALRANPAPFPSPACDEQGWSRFTTGAFELRQVEGHHLWPLEKGSKAAWLGVIAEQLAQL